MANPQSKYINALQNLHGTPDSPGQIIQKSHQTSSAISSPSKPGSKDSVGEQSGLKGSTSVKADAGSRTPSRGTSSDEEPEKLKKSAKRRYGEDESPGRSSRTRTLSRKPGNYPAGTAITSKDKPKGLRPEDVDSKFKRYASAGTFAESDRLTSGLNALHDPAELSKTLPTQSVLPTKNTSDPLANHNPPPASSYVSQPKSPRSRHAGGSRARHHPQWPGLVLQPESREISQEQLAAEVKSIYTGLTMVETKCIHIDKAQAAAPRGESKITNEHWQAMIALHRTLLHEHHDFFLASQHPSASPALKRLAMKYSMPARMWKHGIHSFLELLRHRLPESLEYMLAFIYLAYQMLALLYETVDSFRTTWIECLGDLGRYRMAVEDADIRDREIWAGVARSWYNKAADTNPVIGRLWHHLAILARPNMVQQLYLYNRSLTSIVPFLNAKESIVTILDPVLAGNAKLQVPPIDLDFLKINALLFRRSDLDKVSGLIQKYIQQLDSTVNELGDRWREVGAFTLIAMTGTLYEFGNQNSVLRFLSDQHRKTLQLQDPSCKPQGLPEDQSVQDIRSLPEPDEIGRRVVSFAIELFVSTTGTALSRRGDKNILPMLHLSLAFLLYLYDISEAHTGFNTLDTLTAMFDTFHWQSLCHYLNTLIQTEENINPHFSESILFEEGGRPLPEDWMLRGLAWTFEYCPRDWFKAAAEAEEADRYTELTSTTKARTDRVLSLGARIARIGKHIRFNGDTLRFVIPGGDVEMADEGYGGVVGEDSPEMNEAREDEPRAQHDFQERTAIGATVRRSHQYSSIIADVDVLREISLFEALRRTPLPIIIPEEVITDLLQSEKEHSVKSNEAAVALSNVRSALHDCDSNIRIDTAEGLDVTSKYIDSPSAFTLAQRQPPTHFIPKGPLQRVKTMYNAIEGIARHETDLSFKRTNTGSSSNYSAATADTDLTEMEDDDELPPVSKRSEVIFPRPLLISDNKELRAKADKFGAAALAGWMAKRWLVQGRRHSAAMSQLADAGNNMDLDATTPAESVS